jgi:hypothetical protein
VRHEVVNLRDARALIRRERIAEALEERAKERCAVSEEVAVIVRILIGRYLGND